MVASTKPFHQSARAPHREAHRRIHSPDPGQLAAGEHREPPADTRDIPDQFAARIQHAQRLQGLARISPDDRLAMYLKGLGYSYRDIMAASYTAVNRRITEGRRALHTLEHAREHPDDIEQADSDRDARPPP